MKRHPHVPRSQPTRRQVARLAAGLCAAASGVRARPLRPRLAVLIVIEQFRSDYLDRYGSELSPAGIGALLERGAVFQRSQFRHLTNFAEPNAATLASGAYPSAHGIVSARWYDRTSKRVVEATAADENSVAGPNPMQLRGTTFADEFRLATGGRGRVVAIGDTQSTPILLAGRKPHGCYWQEPPGRAATSPYYGGKNPGWLANFNANAATRVQSYRGAAWHALDTPTGALPLRTLDVSDPDDFASYYRLYQASPFAVQEVFSVARAALAAEALGQRDYTDVLILSTAAPALLGRETGAFSPLMRDLIRRIDRGVGILLGDIDETVGLNQSLVAITGLHGAPVLAEQSRALGIGAGRVDGVDVVKAMNEALTAAFGPTVRVERYVYPFVYLDHGTANPDAARRRRHAEVAGTAASKLEGVVGFWAPGLGATDSSHTGRAARSQFPGRSGDLTLIYEPYYHEDFAAGRGASPGSLYRYDTDVPTLFQGPGIRAGRLGRAVDAAGFAATMSGMLGCGAPSSAGSGWNL